MQRKQNEVIQSYAWTLHAVRAAPLGINMSKEQFIDVDSEAAMNGFSVAKIFKNIFAYYGKRWSKW